MCVVNRNAVFLIYYYLQGCHDKQTYILTSRAQLEKGRVLFLKKITTQHASTDQRGDDATKF